MFITTNAEAGYATASPRQLLSVFDVHTGPVHIDLRTPGTLFCDIDGTVADLEHRRVFVATKPKNWPAFERGIADDGPILPIILAVKTLHASGWKIVMCTGRGAQNKAVTEKWLRDNGVPYHHIYTRAYKDYRRDDIVKLELMELAATEGHVPDVVFDDRDQVVRMWRANGVPCVQVAEGDF